MEKGWIDLLSLFDQRGVRYLIVGGWAVTFYTQPRFTKDLDLLIDPDPLNARVLYDTLAAFGAPMGDMTIEDFQNAKSVYQIGLPPARIDILNSIDEINFKEAWPFRVEAEEQGVRVLYLGREDLVRNKQSSTRLQDLADAEAILNADDAVKSSPRKLK